MSLEKPDEVEMAEQLANMVEGAFLDSAEDDEIARYQNYHNNLVKTPAPDGLTSSERAMAACSFAETALLANVEYLNHLVAQYNRTKERATHAEQDNKAAPDRADREPHQGEVNPQDWKSETIWTDALFEQLWSQALSDKDSNTDVSAFYEALKKVSIRTAIESISSLIYGNRASESDKDIARDIADEWYRRLDAPGRDGNTETHLGMAAFYVLGQVLKGQVDRQKAARSKAKDQPAAVREQGEEEGDDYERNPYGRAPYGPHDVN
jgi:hypothetical protein